SGASALAVGKRSFFMSSRGRRPGPHIRRNIRGCPIRKHARHLCARHSTETRARARSNANTTKMRRPPNVLAALPEYAIALAIAFAAGAAACGGAHGGARNEAPPVVAVTRGAASPDAVLQEPLFPGLGAFHRTVTTRVQAAQRYVDQG